MIKIGDKVKRIKGSNSGMNVGDIGTVMMMKKINGVKHFKIKEYSNGWHKAEYLTIHKDLFDDVKTYAYTTEIDWSKIAKHLNRTIEKETLRRESSELDKLKQQRDELDKKIKYIEENEVETLSTKKVMTKINKMVNDDLIEVNAFRKGRTITVVVANAVTNKTLGKGVATAMPEEKFDTNVGIELAYCRAIENYWKRKGHNVIRETF
ncbi:MAG: hypothetical protein ACRC18_06450 [Cetobacterium sp.]